MYGKHFASMYEGSMRGRGSCFFAVWGYVISHMVPDRNVGTQVELNPDIVAFLIGEGVDNIKTAIDQMCQPDAKSRTKEEDGRKLIRLGEYSYKVVNGAKYRAIRDEEKRREQNRVAQQKFRAKRGQPTTGESIALKAELAGDIKGADAIAAERAKS